MKYQQVCKRKVSSNHTTLWQEFRRVCRYVFDLPEKRLRAGDFVWSYEELADRMPD